MKKDVSILAFSVAAVLASCSSDGVESNPNFPSDGVIRVTTEVGDLTSRAGQDEGNLALFNLSVSYPTDTKYSQYACMRKVDTWDSYNPLTDGTTPLVLKWKDATTPMYVTALGVNNKNRSSTYFTSQSVDSVLADQSHVDSVKASDIVYMPKTEINPTGSPFLTQDGKLKINLKHRFSKLKIVLTLGNDFNPPVSRIGDIKNVQVKGLKRKFEWTPSGDIESLILDSKSIDPITPYGTFDLTGSGVATYECVVVPQELDLAAFKISFMINNKPYEVTLTNPQILEKNIEYTIRATVNSNDPVTGKLSASNWKNGI